MMGTVQLLSNNHLLVNSIFFFYGNEATNALAQQIAFDMQQHWNEPNATIHRKTKTGTYSFE
jgi:hypothetical protein